MDPRAERAERNQELMARLGRTAKSTDESPRLLRAVRLARELLPGDSELGDPLSTAGSDASHLLARRVSEAGSRRDSVTRELGLGALQLWQAASEAQGRGRGAREVAILFTDLVDFSSWALEAGDEAVIELLRRVGLVVEPSIDTRGGQVVKRLGDGLMAVFEDPRAALEAALEARRNVPEIEIAGHRPELRAGLHVGRPRKLGGDYLGVDVNIAARVAAAASGGEVLISEAARARLSPGVFELRRQRGLKAKGAPANLQVYAAEPH
jgi:adenylate cyclase